MKSKELKPRLCYLAKSSFETEGEIKGLPDKKNFKGVYLHKICSAENVKWTAVRRKNRESHDELKWQ